MSRSGAAIDLTSALNECIRISLENGIEHGAYHHAERAVLEFISDEEIHYRTRTAVFVRRLVVKRPAVFQKLEWPVDVLDKNFQARRFAGNSASNPLVDRLETYFHLCDDDLYPLYSRASVPHPKRPPPRHKFGIRFDVEHDCEHVGGAVRHMTAVAEAHHGSAINIPPAIENRCTRNVGAAASLQIQVCQTSFKCAY